MQDDLASEYQITVCIADYLEILNLNGTCLSTHNPMGENRDARTGAKLKKMGTRAGWPDFTIVTETGTYFMEVKTRKGKLQRNQKKIIEDLNIFTNKVYVAYGLPAAIDYINSIITRKPPNLTVIDGSKSFNPNESEIGGSGSKDPV